ncbi:hypothetical protein A2867_04130 [Candidatus Daviesbacteria bacterium RIFCSPHIGHO2_01_FULL_40_11]|uniref:Uncharacterized protein n=1 Tax=Candidatus Daviesbacteria bacterium RIFCSPHIGHO2_01_FULL_40_11 TaxID=1797762 RepID=A0A1F5JJH2_9BACT|nr:MAG: hypothetical protein A2867_04130 [Candidatus Daviesbacteria bacterium RIFCSPHIGHO2_01_FULL_40_11]OGE62893.1 MAG: hypothetical protein A2964_01325 [Candidatus Daviesbacteria bacterium RIFCSPLOWO2_01_FULL_40_27]
MKKANPNLKRIFGESVFGALFTLWTAPIDGPKLDLPSTRVSKEGNNNWFSNNLIIGQSKA